MLLLLLLFAAGPLQDARLACTADEQVVQVAPETGAKKPIEPRPPAAPVALGAAGRRQEARRAWSADGQVVQVAPGAGAKRRMEPRPPAAPVALGAAGDTLVAVSASGSVLQLRAGQWREVTRIGGEGIQK